MTSDTDMSESTWQPWGSKPGQVPCDCGQFDYPHKPCLIRTPEEQALAVARANAAVAEIADELYRQRVVTA